MSKLVLILDIPDRQLEQLKKDAIAGFSAWSDTNLGTATEGKEQYWPSRLELFAMRILLFEMKKESL